MFETVPRKKKSVVLRLIVFGLCITTLASCADPPPVPAMETPARRSLSIGLIPEQNLFRQLEIRHQLVTSHRQSRCVEAGRDQGHRQTVAADRRFLTRLARLVSAVCEQSPSLAILDTQDQRSQMEWSIWEQAGVRCESRQTKRTGRGDNPELFPIVSRKKVRLRGGRASEGR